MGSFLRLGAVSALALLVAGCSTAPGSDGIESGHIRSQAVRDAAMTFGAQSGLAFRMQRIQALCQEQSRQLDRVFNFAGLTLPHHLLPPVLEASEASLQMDGTDTARGADRVINIVQPAHLITTVPSWSAYLAFGRYTPPDIPNATLLPKNARERVVWDDGVEQGWKEGVEQANQVFSENLSRLKRDLNGMMLYRRLHAQGMVSQPFVARAALGITGDAHRMRVNDYVIRITSHAGLQLKHPERWQPALRTPHHRSSNASRS